MHATILQPQVFFSSPWPLPSLEKIPWPCHTTSLEKKQRKYLFICHVASIYFLAAFTATQLSQKMAIDFIFAMHVLLFFYHLCKMPDNPANSQVSDLT